MERSGVIFHDRIEVAAVWEGGGVTEYVSMRETQGRTSSGIEGVRDGVRVSEIPGLGLHDVHGGLAFGVARWPDSTVYAAPLAGGDPVPVLTVPEAGIYNVSVTEVGFYWYMAIETDLYAPFTILFARASNPFGPWERAGGVFSPEAYAACPELLWEPGVGFVMLYLRQHVGGFHIELATSANLTDWEVVGPVLVAEDGEGINNSDPDVVRVPGGLWIYYATGDQQTWGNVRRAWWPGSLASLVEAVARNRQGVPKAPPRAASPDAGDTTIGSTDSRR